MSKCWLLLHYHPSFQGHPTLTLTTQGHGEDAAGYMRVGKLQRTVGEANTYPVASKQARSPPSYPRSAVTATMPIDFYYLLISPPCRAVMLTAEAVGVKLNMKELDIFKGEQMKPEFVALNPQHCIPTLVDGDFVIWESRPTCSYLASKYGKDDSLFPNDPRARADVERLNYFDMGTLFHRFGEYVFPVMFRGEKEFNPDKLARLQEALGWLDGFLSGHKFAAGDNITIADHTLLATVSTIKEANVDLSKHANILAWLEKCKAEVPGYETNQKGAEDWGKFFKSRCNL